MGWSRGYVSDLNHAGFGGFTDWRVPTLEEAMSLMEPIQNEAELFIDPIFDPTQTYIATADKAYEDEFMGWTMWSVAFFGGYCQETQLTDISFLRAVRGGHKL